MKGRITIGNLIPSNKKIALVTGAASGIGWAVAKKLLDEGSIVILADLNVEAVEQLSKDMETESEQSAHVIKVDVSKQESITAMFNWIEDTFGKLDYCVTCAGVISKIKLLDMNLIEWERVVSINMTGTFLCIQQAYKLMIPNESGSIVAIASDTAKRGGGRIGTAAYGASKGGVLSMVKSIAREMAHSGIRINSICPGPADTSMHGELNDHTRRQVAESIPLGRFARPEEIANVVTFLCSDKSSYIYGESVNVDGGVIME